MCWTQFITIGHILKNLRASQKTLHSPWCPKLVTDLAMTNRFYSLVLLDFLCDVDYGP